MSSIVIAGDTSGSVTLQAPAVSGSSVLSLPAVTDTVVGIAATQTLTNKTLTSPVLTTPALGTPASGVLTNATGINYDGFKNRIINGAMVIDQRNAGASISGNAYVVDRFYGSKSSATVVYQQSSTVPTGFTKSLSLSVTTGAATGATDGSSIQQGIEGYNTADLGWGTANATTVTLSFWVRSSVTGTYGVSFRNGSGNRSYIASYTINSANTYEYKTITISGDTTGTWATDNTSGIYINFDMGVGSTYSTTAGSWQAGNYFGLTGGTKIQTTTGATFYITGVQLEKGSTATSFDVRSYGTELALCQRYYYRITSTGDNCFGSGWAGSGTQGVVMIPYPVTMRTKPTALEQSGTAANYRIIYSNTATACNSVPTFSAITSEINAGVNFFVASGLTTGIGLGAQVTPSTTAYLGWSAEL